MRARHKAVHRAAVIPCSANNHWECRCTAVHIWSDPPDMHHPHPEENYNVAIPTTWACRLDDPCGVDSSPQTTYARILSWALRENPNTKARVVAIIQNFAPHAHCVQGIPIKALCMLSHHMPAPKCIMVAGGLTQLMDPPPPSDSTQLFRCIVSGLPITVGVLLHYTCLSFQPDFGSWVCSTVVTVRSDISSFHLVLFPPLLPPMQTADHHRVHPGARNGKRQLEVGIFDGK